MVTEEPRTSSVVKVPGEPVIEGELAVVVVPGVPVGLVAPEDPVAREVRAALAAQEDLAVPAVLVVPENPAVLVAPVQAIDLAAAPVQAIAPAAELVQVIDPVAAVLGIAQAEEPAPATVQVAGVPELDPVAAALQQRIRSAIAPRPRGLRLHLAAEEDLEAVAAGIMPEPAATGAATAWAAAA